MLYEYLICGKPVVATVFPASVERRELVRTARTDEAFARALDAALATDGDQEAVRARVAFGFANTWEHRAAAALEIIDAALRRREGTK